MTKQELDTQLTKGTRIWYNGDKANEEGKGKIVKRTETEYGPLVYIVLDDGRKFDIFTAGFSPVYLGHGGTRFVTWDAYSTYRKQKIANMKAEYIRINS